ncbi:MAG: diacylglycerol kinase family lipid kinase [Candidatus Marinimicrobia bacterium]|nr:diacylglycerol kinase family lipid kinase [Candidatus Neomarinimicrobiota bacterium]MCF7828820.1 diacylglycerol kinase family lipid kinase [Candidatus Neomarinimicrobiota bacterium]MCF7880737.1 diacylglycerol kinase family lipid kinase [Candidatus Neomarinimicrobiota bacterium]
MNEKSIKMVKMIINPTAGGGKGRKELEHVLRVFRSHRIEVELVVTEYHEHAIEIAEQSQFEEYDAVVAAGGDGTVYHVINGLMRHPESDRKPLGIIPLGTGNAGAWDTAGVREINSAVETIAGGKTRWVDVGTFLMDHRTYYFLNVIGVGFVADVGKIAVKMKRFGEIAYTFGVLWETLFLKSHHMHFEMNGDVFDLQGTFVEFCNTRYTAADMLMAPDAKIDDGYIDMVVCKALNRRRLLTAFPKVFKGTHTEMEEIDIHKIKSVKLWTEEPKVLIPDGEIFGRTPIEVGIEPGALEVFNRMSE